MVVFGLAGASARAFDLDDVLPINITGYGMPFSVTDVNRLRRQDDSAGIRIGDLELDPELDLNGGYDSAPNGVTHGSAMFREMPSLMVVDNQLGLDAFVAGTATQFPETSRQNVSGGTVALGERVVLPNETITVSTAYIRAQETGFAITTLALSKPLAFSVADVRANDVITAGVFTVKPEVSVSNYRFDGLSVENRTDDREGLTTAYAPGGPVQLVLFLHATQSDYTARFFSADTEEALAGIGDDEAGLLNLRLLAGAAHRQSDSGDLTTPVVEGSVDWIPGDLDKLRLRFSREVDDPSQISETSYKLTDASFSLRHEYLRNVILDASLQAAHASYIQSPLRETLFSTDEAVEWQLNAMLAVKADYTFNDRQANFLRAANENVVTLGLRWTP